MGTILAWPHLSVGKPGFRNFIWETALGERKPSIVCFAEEDQEARLVGLVKPGAYLGASSELLTVEGS